MTSINLSYNEAEKHIKEGDVLLFSGTNLISKTLQTVGEGRYNHCGIASWCGSERLECVQFKEWRGGISTNLKNEVKIYTGTIDVYRPADHFVSFAYSEEHNSVQKIRIPFNGRAVSNEMRSLTGLPYGWNRIWWLAKYNMSLLKFLYKTEDLINDEVKELIYPVCSTALAHCYNIHGYDLISNRSDEYVEPSDLARSSRISYLFTLIS